MRSAVRPALVAQGAISGHSRDGALSRQVGGGIRMRRVDMMGDAQDKGGAGKGETVKHSRTNRRGKSNLEERWLERKVRDMYQEVVNEPVPQELLDIVKRIPKLDD
jgi:Anti-sigma factor NepR